MVQPAQHSVKQTSAKYLTMLEKSYYSITFPQHLLLSYPLLQACVITNNIFLTSYVWRKQGFTNYFHISSSSDSCSWFSCQCKQRRKHFAYTQEYLYSYEVTSIHIHSRVYVPQLGNLVFTVRFLECIQ